MGKEGFSLHPAVLEPFLTAMRRADLRVEILDETGWKLYSEDAAGIPDESVAGIMWPLDVSPVVENGRAYLLMDADPVYAISTEATGASSLGQLYLAGALLRSLIAVNGGLVDGVQALRRIMTERCDDAEIEAMAQDQSLVMEADRMVMLFHAVTANVENVTRVLQTLFPSDTGDWVVPIDRHIVALCKTVSPGTAFEEIEQLANAVDDSVQTEAGIDLLIGISEIHRSLADLSEAMREARAAINTGRAFHPEKRVFAYRRLMLERFLSEADPEIMTRYHGLVFGRKYARLLSAEMIHTIECFFSCNLNLSEAARQLYIHRNTLVYRLDKFQRATGLDLRTFDDAVTLRILMMLGRSSYLRRGRV